MAWNLIGVIAHAGRALGLRGRTTDQATSLRFAATARASSAAARAYGRAAARLEEEDRFAIAKAVIDLDADGHAATERALASGAPPAAVLAFAKAWPTLQPLERAIATNPTMRTDPGPVVWAGVHAKQVDQTTCGAASMSMMLAIGDPFVAVWLASGKTFARHVPPEIARIPEGRSLKDVEERWHALQRSIHHQTTRRGLGLFAWPSKLGTPPWRVDNNTRFLDLRFRGLLVDDEDAAELGRVLAYATAALKDGIPVPVYAAGDSDLGLDTVIPRHVVLLVARDGDGFLAYEPSSARLHRVTDEDLEAGGPKLKALGNWTRLAWTVLPRVRATS